MDRCGDGNVALASRGFPPGIERRTVAGLGQQSAGAMAGAASPARDRSLPRHTHVHGRCGLSVTCQPRRAWGAGAEAHTWIWSTGRRDPGPHPGAPGAVLVGRPRRAGSPGWAWFKENAPGNPSRRLWDGGGRPCRPDRPAVARRERARAYCSPPTFGDPIGESTDQLMTRRPRLIAGVWRVPGARSSGGCWVV